MKINSLNIASFGSLKNKKIDFSDGFNIIYGDNENGKTTIMAFIKMMFYGSERGSSQISKNIRKKYTPWDVSSMAGSIDFTHSGRNYRIEREFRSSNSTDKVTLCDLDLGTRNPCESDIGLKFFGISSAAFDRSVFINQFGFPGGDPDGELSNRLSNIALTGDESVSFDTVSTRIEKAKNALTSKTRTAGILDKNLKKIADLKSRIEKAVMVGETNLKAKEKIAEIVKIATEKQKKVALLKEQISKEQDFRNLQKLEQLLELKEQLDKLNEDLILKDGTLADESFVKKLEFCYKRQSTAKAKFDSKVKEISIIENNLSALGGSPEQKEDAKNALETEVLEKSKNLSILTEKQRNLSIEENDTMLKLTDSSAFKKKFNLLLLVGGIIVFVLGLISIAFLGGLGIGLSLLGIITAVLGFVIRPIDKIALDECRKKASLIKRELSELSIKEKELSNELSALKTKLQVINTALEGNEETLRKTTEMLTIAKSELTLLEEELKAGNDVLKELFDRSNKPLSGDIENDISYFQTNATKQKDIKQQMNYILKDVGNISYELAREKLLELKGNSENSKIDFSNIKAEYDRLLGEISELKSEAAAICARADSAMSGAENPETLKRELAELIKTANAQEEYCKTCDTALEILNESYIEVRRSYGSQLEKDSAAILSKLTGNKYGSMSISKSFDVAVEETDVFGAREIDYLSSGTSDQTYLSLRLSLSKLICEDESLPILMDDVLAQYDDKRTILALEFLKEYSSDNQIIFFTCHNDLCEKSKGFATSIKTL